MLQPVPTVQARKDCINHFRQEKPLEGGIFIDFIREVLEICIKHKSAHYSFCDLPWQSLYFLPLPHGQGSLRSMNFIVCFKFVTGGVFTC